MTDQPVASPTPEQGETVMIPPLGLVQPSPVEVGTTTATGPEGTFVIARYETVVGSIAILLTPEQARLHGEELIRRSAQSSSGLFIPPGSRL